MKAFIRRLARKAAPRTVENLIFLSESGTKGSDVVELVREYREELTELQAQINEIRRNERRMAELYDLVFEHVRRDQDDE